MDWIVEFLDVDEEIIATERYVGLHSMSALYYRLARDTQMREDLKDAIAANVRPIGDD